MSKESGDSLFISWHPTGIVAAKGASYNAPFNLTEIKSFPTHDHRSSPLGVLDDWIGEKKGFVEAVMSVNNADFFHFLHEVETLTKAKSPDYFPKLVKDFLSGKDDDVFYHILNNGDGEPYNPENLIEKNLIVSGIRTAHLATLQDQITQENIFPKKLYCSTLGMLGFLKQQMKQNEEKSPLLFLEIYENDSQLIIVPPQGKPVFRSVHSGELAMCEQIRDELGLKDTASSQKLLYSKTIDLSDIGRHVVNPIFQGVAASVGMFEVETGQSISKLFVSNLSPDHRWVSELLAKDLGMDLLEVDHDAMIKDLGIEINDGVEWDRNDARFVSLFTTIGEQL